MSKLDCASTNGVLPRKKAELAAIGVLLGFDGRSYGAPCKWVIPL